MLAAFHVALQNKMALAIKQCVSCRVTSGLQNHGREELEERKELALTSVVP